MITDIQKFKIELPLILPEPSPDEVKSMFEFYTERLNFYGYEKREEKSFNMLANYFSRFYWGIQHEVRPKSERYRRPSHGMLLYGPCGTGKTKALEIFSIIFKIPVIYIDVLIEQFATRGETGFWDYVERFRGLDITLDDIANEREVKCFGNASPIVDFIYRREREYRDSGVLTNFSSNAKTEEEIEARYGTPAKSRIIGMTEQILINGIDGRSCDNSDVSTPYKDN